MIDRAGDDYILDITHALSLLGWPPKRGLRETMPKMVEALKADPLGSYREHGLELPASMPAVNDTDEAETPEPAIADAHAGHDRSDAGQKTRPVRMAARLPYKMAGTPAAGTTELAPVYTCPMHPEIRQSSPGNCPRSGMTLEPGA